MNSHTKKMKTQITKTGFGFKGVANLNGFLKFHADAIDSRSYQVPLFLYTEKYSPPFHFQPHGQGLSDLKIYNT